jgi:hypothetical protein
MSTSLPHNHESSPALGFHFEPAAVLFEGFSRTSHLILISRTGSCYFRIPSEDGFWL